MAVKYFSVGTGKGEQTVVSAGSAPTADVFVAYEDSTVTRRQDILEALEKIMNAIQRGSFPI